ncbi:MAG: DUF4855 domain-containing protein, partial [Clostridia bacterium]|nr:DUF4855 domain-containing protein [Clostridia bacterium]
MKTSEEYYGVFDIHGEDITRAPSKERVNLIKGLTPAIRAHCPIEDRHCTEWFNQFPDNGLLIDGGYAENEVYDDPAFFHITGGEARDIVFDLGSLCAVEGFRIGILRHTRYGLFQPPRVKLFLSADGVNWQSGGSVTGFETWGKSKVIRPEHNLESPIAARYAKFFFNVPFHIWIDEIELFGRTDASGVPSAANDGSDGADCPGRFASTEQLGAKDVMLAYMCRTDIPPVNKEMLLPYVGYIENGVITDTMFDSFLFLPHVWFLYKGNEKLPLKKADWQFFMDHDFRKGQ